MIVARFIDFKINSFKYTKKCFFFRLLMIEIFRDTLIFFKKFINFFLYFFFIFISFFHSVMMISLKSAKK